MIAALLRLYGMFVRYGLLCFGGGYVLVPLFVHELVEQRGVLSRELFGNLVAIAQMTPGPIGVNTATFVGYTQCGVAGAVVGTLGLLTPAVVLVSCTVASFRRWERHWLVQGLLSGVRPVTIGLIASALVIFAELSLFTGPLPHHHLWPAVCGREPWCAVADSARALGVRWPAVAISVGCVVLLERTRTKVLWLIVGSSILGALWWGVVARA